MMKHALIVAIFLTGSVTAQAPPPLGSGGTPVEINGGFITGMAYLEFSSLERRRYAVGVIDGMFLAPLFGAAPATMQRLEQCIKPMNDEQVAAILSVFLETHPERWHDSAHAILFSALSERCPR